MYKKRLQNCNRGATTKRGTPLYITLYGKVWYTFFRKKLQQFPYMGVFPQIEHFIPFASLVRY